MQKPLTIIAKILAKPEYADVIKEKLIKLLEPTRAEAGCLNYDFYQDNENPNLFFLYENWASHNHWQQHMESDHVKNYIEKTTGMTDEFSGSHLTEI